MICFIVRVVMAEQQIEGFLSIAVWCAEGPVLDYGSHVHMFHVFLCT